MTSTIHAGTSAMTPAGLPMFGAAGDDFARYYAENGFALLADGLSRDEVTAVNADALRLCRGDFGDIPYDYDDTDEVEQVERRSVIAGPMSDEETLRQFLCVHYPHKVSPAAMAGCGRPASWTPWCG